MRIEKFLFLNFFVFLFLLNFSCKKSPDECYCEISNAVIKRNEQEVMKYLNKKSNKILENLKNFEEKTRRQLKSSLNIFSIIPVGKIKEVKIEKNGALLTLEDKGKEEKIIMIKEDGEWKIDITFLKKFYEEFSSIE